MPPPSMFQELRSKVRARISDSAKALHEAQKTLGAVHIFVLLVTLIILTVVTTICFRHWQWPTLAQLFVCFSIATLVAGFAALFLDILNKPEKLGYLLLAISVTCFYWSEREQQHFTLPPEVVKLVQKSNLFPFSFLEDLWKKLNSNIPAISGPAAAQARQLLLNKDTAPAIAPLSAASLVVAAEKGPSEKSNAEEVRKTTVILEQIKGDLPADTKKYVNEQLQQAGVKIDEAKAKTSEEITPTPTPAQSPAQDSTESAVADGPKDLIGTAQKAARETAELSKAKIEQVAERGGQVSDHDIKQAILPVTEIVKAADTTAENEPVDSINSQEPAVIRNEATDAVVPGGSPELSDHEAVPTHEVSGSAETHDAGSQPPAPDPNKAQPVKDKKSLDNVKSLKLEAELLLAIGVIENIAKNSPNKELPYAQLRELRLRLDNKKNGDLRNLQQPSKDRVLAKLNELDKRLRKQGGAKARATKKFPEANLLRVGFLFPDESQRLNVRFAQIDLNRNSATPFYCPAIENVGKKGNIPAATEIRYFEYSIFGWLRPKDAESHAARLAALLKTTIPGVGTIRTVYYQPKRDDERPGNFEVWFSRSAFRR